jgi:hypothetical protein
MPMVGKKEYAYTAKGMAMAKADAKKSGKKMVMKKTAKKKVAKKSARRGMFGSK